MSRHHRPQKHRESKMKRSLNPSLENHHHREREREREEETEEEREIAIRKFLEDSAPEVTTQVLERALRIFPGARASSSSSAAEPPVNIIGIAKGHGLTAANIYELTDEAI
eukprot:12423002-Karenia_brevis.AAC.1